jgi:hypothetical protein
MEQTMNEAASNRVWSVGKEITNTPLEEESRSLGERITIGRYSSTVPFVDAIHRHVGWPGRNRCGFTGKNCAVSK